MQSDEATRQIEKMVNFVVNEAKDKAAEIEAQTQEQFSIQKLKMLQDGKANIRLKLAEKKKREEIEKVVAQSRERNKQRLQKAAAKRAVIKAIAKDANKAIGKASADEEVYALLLRKLAVQAMVDLMEPNVLFVVREKDKELAETIVKGTQQDYADLLAMAGVEPAAAHVGINFSPQFLPDDSLGGVIVTTPDSLISVDNSLDERLAAYMRQCVPELRAMLISA